MTFKTFVAVAVLGAGVAFAAGAAEAQPVQLVSQQCGTSFSSASGCGQPGGFMSGLSAPYDMRCQSGFIPQVYPNGSGFRCVSVDGVASYPKP